MAERIRVDVERTGGFAGLPGPPGRPTLASADTDSLSAEESRQLARLVDELDLEALRAARAPATRSVPDAFEYDVRIARGAEQVRVHARDPDLPPELRPLVRFVLQRRT